MAQEIKNGDYTIDVRLSGGSGKATVSSPAKINVKDSVITAEIDWSSPNYDYMEIDGKEYRPVNTGGNSRFIVEVPALDEEIPIKAETTAMSQPHMIEYTLYFDSASISEPIGMTGTTVEFVIIGAAIIASAVAIALGRRRQNAKK